MEANDIREYIKKHNIKSYEISKKTGLSITGIDYFINNNSNPRRKTLQILSDFVEDDKDSNNYQINNKENQLNEPNTNYNKVSNADIFAAIQQLATSLGENGIHMTDMLIKTFNNTKTILKTTHQIDINIIELNNKKLSKNH